MPQDLWAAIDFETATREATSACALGVALIDGLEVAETFSWLIQPPFNEYEYRNTLVHGIGPDDTALAPEFDEIWWEVRHVLQGRRLLAHNAAFDMRVLRALIETRDLPAPRYEYACTLALARKTYPHLPRHTLDVVCGHCGIDLMHHEAESDASACARLAVACARDVSAPSLMSALAAKEISVRSI